MLSAGSVPVELSSLVIHAYLSRLSSSSQIKSNNKSGNAYYDSQTYKINLSNAVYPEYYYVTQNQYKTSWSHLSIHYLPAWCNFWNDKILNDYAASFHYIGAFSPLIMSYCEYFSTKGKKLISENILQFTNWTDRKSVV